MIPHKIKIITIYETSEVSYCTLYQSDGSLLVGTGDGMMIYREDYSKPQQTLSGHAITSTDKNMGEEGGYVFISHQKDLRTVKLTTDFICQSDCFEFEYKGTRGTFLATSAKVIAVIALKCIKLYSKGSLLLCTKYFDYQPLQIRFDEHGDLLVTGNNELRKYDVSEGSRDGQGYDYDMVG